MHMTNCRFIIENIETFPTTSFGICAPIYFAVSGGSNLAMTQLYQCEAPCWITESSEKASQVEKQGAAEVSPRCVWFIFCLKLLQLIWGACRPTRYTVTQHWRSKWMNVNIGVHLATEVSWNSCHANKGSVLRLYKGSMVSWRWQTCFSGSHPASSS